MRRRLRETTPTDFTLEAGLWLTMRREQPHLQGHTDQQLLKATNRLFAPLRYVRSSSGGVFLLGECPLASAEDLALGSAPLSSQAIAHEKERLLNWMKRPERRGPRPIDDETLEGALSECGIEWSRRDDAWVVHATAQSAAQMQIQIQKVPRGVRVESLLVEGDPEVLLVWQARDAFLCRAQAALRFARAERHQSSIRVVSEVEAESFADFFPHCLMSVTEACRLLSAEVRALGSPEVARAYLECHSAQLVGA